MEKNSKIYVAGHTGLIGSAITQELKRQGYENLILKTHEELDLLDSVKVSDFFKKQKPEYVFLAAARVGGINANITFPADFIYENLSVQSNVIHNSYLNGVKRLLFLASSCIYPRECSQPMKEEYLLTGKPEPTNEAYAVAKIAGLKMCESYNNQYHTNYLCVIPSNIYGVNCSFNPEYSHVIPALISKIHRAKVRGEKSVAIWGSGNPRREFLFAGDAANACIFLMKNYFSKEPINVGSGYDITIKELSRLICEVINYKGQLEFDPSMPDGIPQKLLDISKITSLNWKPAMDLKSGLAITYQWYLENVELKSESILL